MEDIGWGRYKRKSKILAENCCFRGKAEKNLRLWNSKLEGDKIELSQITREKKAGSVPTVYVTSSLIAPFFYFQTCFKDLVKRDSWLFILPWYFTFRSSYTIPVCWLFLTLNTRYQSRMVYSFKSQQWTRVIDKVKDNLGWSKTMLQNWLFFVRSS